MADSPQLAPVRRPIVFWGPRNSGKTTFLGRMLMRPAEFDDAGEWHVSPADERSADYAADVLETLRREGSVRPTLVTEQPFRFRLQRRRRRLGLRPGVSEWDLVVLDPKGELFLRNRLRESEDGAMLQLIAQAHGLLLLIDPGGDAADSYWELLADNIHEFVMAMKRGDPARCLDGVNRIRIPTAVCLTKMDLYPEYEDAHSFLQQRLGAAFDLVQRSFTNYRVFACSALATPPWGLLPPLQWLTAETRIRLPF